MFYVPTELTLSSGAKGFSTWCGVETWWAKIRTGKTHHIVKTRVIPALKEGRHVFTNIDFGRDLIVDEKIVMSAQSRAALLFSSYLKKDVRSLLHIVGTEFFTCQLGLKDTNAELTCVPRGSRIIIDEAQNVFPVTGYKTAPENFFKLLTYCGHFDIDFCFITQNPALMDKRIISTSSELIMIKNLGLFSSFFQNGYRLSHRQSLYDYEGYDSSLHKFDPDIFKLYKSADTVVKKKFKAVPPFMLVPVLGVFLILGFWAFKGSKSSWWGGKGYNAAISSIQAPAALPASSPTPPPVLSSGLSLGQFRPVRDALNELTTLTAEKLPDPTQTCTYFVTPGGPRSSICMKSPPEPPASGAGSQGD